MCKKTHSCLSLTYKLNKARSTKQLIIRDSAIHLFSMFLWVELAEHLHNPLLFFLCLAKVTQVANGFKRGIEAHFSTPKLQLQTARPSEPSFLQTQILDRHIRIIDTILCCMMESANFSCKPISTKQHNFKIFNLHSLPADLLYPRFFYTDITNQLVRFPPLICKFRLFISPLCLYII